MTVYADDWATRNFSVTGIPLFGFKMQQNGYAPYLLESYILANEFKNIVELGSGYGALSIHLANLCGVAGDITFHTYETNMERWQGPHGAGKWFERLCSLEPRIHFHSDSVFDDKTIAGVKEYSKNKKTLIIADNGHKIKEFIVYAPILKPKDVIMPHDWGTEILEKDVVFAINDCGLRKHEPWASYFSRYETLLMPFVRVG